MRRADRHRGGDRGQQHEAEQHALQLEVLRGEQKAAHPSRRRSATRNREPPAPTQGLRVIGTGPRKIVPQDIETKVTAR